MAKADTVDVFDYLDYRAFLRDYYAHQKAARRSFSFRSFSRRAKLSSPNHLKRVMEGDRNLTAEMAKRFASACGLSDEESEYFENLVAFNQSRTTGEQAKAYAKLTGFRRYRAAHRLDVAHAAYHATWYLPAIRELAARLDFIADAEWISKRMVPSISTVEATRALRTLRELGMLVEDDSGRLAPAEAVVSTGPELHLLHIASYHLMMLERAAASIDLVASERRDISSVTMLVGEDGLQRLKKRIQRFRRELIELSLLEDEGDQVVQLNFQLFPLTTSRREDSQP